MSDVRPCMLAIVVAVTLLAAAGFAQDPVADGESATWPLGRLEIETGGLLDTWRLRPLLSVSPRPWYAPWRDRPLVSRSQVEDDVERVRVWYRSRGYYHAEVAGDLTVDPDDELATIRITVEEGVPVRVDAVHVDLVKRGGVHQTLPQLRAKVPLEPDDVFTHEDYERGRAALRTFYRGRGFARVQVEKRARVDVQTNLAEVWYTITPGPPHCVFGSVAVEGLRRVTEDVVRREIDFEEGAPFDPERIEATRSNLRALNLFESIRIVEDDERVRRVDLTVQVREAPHREVRLGVGYDTEEGVRGLAGWRSYDFLGGARQLGFSARASLIRRTIVADFVQPHFPMHASYVRLLFLQEQQEEESFTVLRTRLMPRLEWEVTRRLSTYLFYRIEYDDLSSVEAPVARALAPDATPSNALLSGAGIGVDWVDVDDVLDPHEGWTLGGSAEPVGGILGGDASFVRLGAVGRGWVPLPWRFTLASRVNVGTLEPFGDTDEIPVWERAYAGGTDSVRGYARYRVGPLVNDDPLGGRSWFVGSVELRRPLWQSFSAAAFADAGSLSLQSFSFPFDDVQVGVGGGLRYSSPIGPIRIDIGFPLDRRGSDDAWQLHFAVGQSF